MKNIIKTLDGYNVIFSFCSELKIRSLLYHEVHIS
jgi:hypothetical protein